MKTINPAVRGLVVTACLAAMVGAHAQSAPEKAIKARQSAYYLIGDQMARINATAKGDLAFDKAAMQQSGEILGLLSKAVHSYFPAGSDQGAPTKAKPEVWKEAARFKQLGEASHEETLKLKTALATGDLAAIKAAYGATAKSCKACHDNFKEK